MKTGRIVVATAVAAVAASAGAQVFSGPFFYNGHEYYVLEQDTWTACEAAAVAMGGHLVTINDADENAWVFATLIPPEPHPLRDIWIGLNDVAVEGEFIWSSGEPTTYTNWYTGEPNGGRTENWVHMYPVGSGAARWNDNVDREYFGAVEIDRLCYADCDRDTELTLFDFLCFQSLFTAADPAADCDGDGELTFFDFLCFQNAFSAGCP